MNIVFATNNLHKISEVSNQMHRNVNLLSLKDVNFTKELPETTGTIEGNAIQKASYLFAETGLNCFADDSGLEIEALNLNPGVDSAHYAGPQRSHADNIARVLEELNNIENRKARFKTVFALCFKGKIEVFEGVIYGVITKEIHGKEGFGYDPIFLPDGYDKTFAEMSFDLKIKISHRAIALEKLNFWLESNIVFL